MDTNSHLFARMPHTRPQSRSEPLERFQSVANKVDRLEMGNLDRDLAPVGSNQIDAGLMQEDLSYRLLRKLRLYQTKAKFYLVGSTGDKQHFRICKFSRLEVSAAKSLPASV